MPRLKLAIYAIITILHFLLSADGFPILLRSVCQRRVPRSELTVQNMALSKKDLESIKGLLVDGENRTQQMTRHMITESENRTRHMITESENRTRHMITESEHRTRQMITSISDQIADMHGIMTESYVRQVLIRKSSEASDQCLVQSLPDLVKLVGSCVEGPLIAGTRDLAIAFKEKKLQPCQDQVTDKRVKLLVNYIYESKDVIKAKLIDTYKIKPDFADSIFAAKGTYKLPAAENDMEMKIKRFETMNVENRKYALETCDGFGMLLFSCCCDVDPTHELEFDAMPSIEKAPKLLIIKVIEIKSSRYSVSTAVSQLRRRLNILERAAIVTFGNGATAFKRGSVIIPAWEKIVGAEYMPDYSKLGFQLDIVYV